MNEIGRLLIGVGVILVVVGLAFLVFGRLGLGKLPGDIVVRRGNFTLYFPIVTSIVISIVLSFLLWVFRR